MKKFLYPLLLCILFTVSLFGQYTDEKYEKYIGYARGKYPLTFSGLQRAISAIVAVDSGVVNIAYPGVDTTGLGALPPRVYLRGWIGGEEIVSGVVAGTGTWGYITGNILSQTDLQEALSDKLDLADTLHKVNTSNLLYNNKAAMRDTLLFSDPYEKFLGTEDGKYDLTLVGLQSAVGDLPNDSGSVYVSYPGIDTTGLGIVSSNTTVWGWTLTYVSGSDIQESCVFRILTSASSSGNFYTYIEGVTYTTAITSGDVNTIIATKVYNTLYGNVPGWTISRNSADITLTRNAHGNVTNPSYNATATGATVSIISPIEGDSKFYRSSYTNAGGDIVTTPSLSKVVILSDSVGIRGDLNIGDDLRVGGNFDIDGGLTLNSLQISNDLFDPFSLLQSIFVGDINEASIAGGILTAADITYMVPGRMIYTLNGIRSEGHIYNLGNLTNMGRSYLGNSVFTTLTVDSTLISTRVLDEDTEIISNGAFDFNLDGWTQTSGTWQQVPTGGGRVACFVGGTLTLNSASLAIGQKYKLKFDKLVNPASCTFYNGVTALGTYTTPANDITIYFTATSADLHLTSDALPSYDNISLTTYSTITHTGSNIALDVDSVNVSHNFMVDGGVYFYGGTGDINGDGSIYGEDYTLLWDYLQRTGTLTRQEYMRADVNGDGKVSWDDYACYRALQGFEDLNSPEYKLAKANIIRIINSVYGVSGVDTFYVYKNLVVDQNVNVHGAATFGDYTFPLSDGDPYTILKTDGNGNVYWGADATGGSPTWGSITGTLSNQSDLQSALNLKANTTHNHAASNITSGILDTARFHAYGDLVVENKIGTGSGQVATGNHGHAIGGVTNLQDSLTVKLNRNELDIAPSKIQDSLTAKLNRSEYALRDTNHYVSYDRVQGLPDTTAVTDNYVMKYNFDNHSIFWGADATGGSPVWGDISGSLADQDDLWDTLAIKLENVVEDATPVLGGSLDLNDQNITNTTPTFTLTPTILNYFSTATSDIQAQINGKAATAHTHTIANTTNLQDSLTAKTNKSWFSIPPSKIDDSISVKANTAWFSIPPSKIDDSITVKLNRSELDIAPSKIQDSLLAKTNIAWFSIPPSKIDDSITVKLNRSETSAWDKNGSNDLTTSTTFSGDVTGSYNSTVVGDDSHSHVISNVDNLQDSLTAKLNRSETSAWDKNGSNDVLRADSTGSAAGSYVTRYQFLNNLGGTVTPEQLHDTADVLRGEIASSAEGDTSGYSINEIDSLLALAGTAVQPSQIQGDTSAYTIEALDSTIAAMHGGTTGQVLTKNSNADFDASWADPTGGGIVDIVDDTSPQLGGSLDLNDQNITNTTPTFTLTPTEMSNIDEGTANFQTQINALYDSIAVLRDFINEYLAGVDSFPNPFSFSAQTGVALSTPVLSNVQPLNNFDVTIYPHINSPVAGDSLRIKHSNVWGSWKTTASAVEGDSIQIKLTSSSNYATVKTDTVHASTRRVVFSTTTVTNPAPSAPTNLLASPISTSSVRITWTNPGDGDLDSIRIYRASWGDSTNYSYVGRVYKSASPLRFDDTGLSSNTAYWYKAKAVDTEDNLSGYSNRDSAKTFTPAGDLGFAHYDAESGLTGLTVRNGNDDPGPPGAQRVYVTTEQAYGGSHSYKLVGFGGTGDTSHSWMETASFTGKSTIWVTYRVLIPWGTLESDGGWNFLTLFHGADHYTVGSTGAEATNDTLYQWQFNQVGTGTNWAGGVWHKIETKLTVGSAGTTVDSAWVDGTFAYGITNGPATTAIDWLVFGGFNWSLAVGEVIYYDDIILSENRIIE